MDHRALSNLLLVTLAVAISATSLGCRGMAEASGLLRPAQNGNHTPAAHGTDAASSAQTNSASQASGGAAASATSHQAEVEALVSQVAEAGNLTPQERSQLAADLAAADQATWPMIAQMLRTSLAHRAKVEAQSGAIVQERNSPSSEQRTALADQATPRSQIAENRSHAAGEPIAGEPVAREQTTVEPVAAELATGESITAAKPPAALADGGATATATLTPAALTPAVPAMASAPDETCGPVPASGIVPTSGTVDGQPRDWQVTLASAIADLEGNLGSQSLPDSPEQQARLRLLRMASGKRDEALRPIEQLSAEQQEFWSQQVFGLWTLLDERRPARSQRIAEAHHHLQAALDELASEAPLVVRSLTFCTEVTSYGVYQTLTRNEFTPGQQLLLYAEVDHLATQSTPRGHRTSIKASYQLLDGQGRRVVQRDLPAAEEVCRNRRRDYFVRYFLSLPETLPEDRYTLQLTLEDTVGQKIGQSSIELLVRPK